MRRIAGECVFVDRDVWQDWPQSWLGKFGLGKFGLGKFGLGKFGLGKFGSGRIDVVAGIGVHGASGTAMTTLQHFSRFKALHAFRLNGQS